MYEEGVGPIRSKRTRRVFLAGLLLCGILLSALAIGLLPAVLESEVFRRCAERTLTRAVGPASIDAIEFEYPFDLRLKGLSLKGRAAGLDLTIFLHQVRVASGPRGLLFRHVVEEAAITGLTARIEVPPRVASEKASEDAGRSLGALLPTVRVPWWVWHLGSVHILESGVTILSGGKTLSIERAGVFWSLTGPGRQADLGVSVGGGEAGASCLWFHLTEDSIRPSRGSLVLPPLDLSNVLALVGTDLPVSGTISCVVSPGTESSLGRALVLDVDGKDLLIRAGSSRFEARGSFHSTMELSGDRARARVGGAVSLRGVRVAVRGGEPVEVASYVSVEGTLTDGVPERVSLTTERPLEISKIGAARLGVVYTPHRLDWQIAADLRSLEGLGAVLEPLVPEPLKGFAWKGGISLSFSGSRDLEAEGATSGVFSLKCRQTAFNSGDFQKMGEKIGLEAKGRILARSAAASRVPQIELFSEIRVDEGELVWGGFYANMAKIRPGVIADLAIRPGQAAVEVRSAACALQEIGEIHARGLVSASKQGFGVEARVEIPQIALEGASRLLVRDGLAGSFPFLKGLTAEGALSLDASVCVSGGSYGVRGSLSLVNASCALPAIGFSIESMDMALPFSLGSPSALEVRGTRREGIRSEGNITASGIVYKNITVPTLDTRILVADDALALAAPLSLSLAGGSLRVVSFACQRILSGSRKGEGSLEFSDIAVAPLSSSLFGKDAGGRLSGRLEEITFGGGGVGIRGSLEYAVGRGRAVIENIDARFLRRGSSSGTCRISVEGLPLREVLGSSANLPFDVSVNGDLSALRLASGRLATSGCLRLETLGGTVTLCHIGARGVESADAELLADIVIEGIDLAELTRPFSFGSVSGILSGDIKGLAVGRRFPYARSFTADLRTVKRKGVAQKIDATAVNRLARIGGSSGLATALSSGLYRYFDEYYYKEMGIRLVLEDGWVDIHGIEKGGQEYLIVRGLRAPSISMPIKVLTPNRKVWFSSWLRDMIRVGAGQ